MEFFRKNQKLIVGLIALSFVLMALAPILMSIIAYKNQ